MKRPFDRKPAVFLKHFAATAIAPIAVSRAGASEDDLMIWLADKEFAADFKRLCNAFTAQGVPRLAEEYFVEACAMLIASGFGVPEAKA